MCIRDRCIEAKAVTADDDGHAVTDPDHIAFINPFRYRGYMYDAETGFYLTGTRYYDPVIGRFINADNPEILMEDQEMCIRDSLLYDTQVPAYNATPLDYSITPAGATQNVTTTFDVTKAVQDWVTSGNNQGILLRSTSWQSGLVKYIASDTGGDEEEDVYKRQGQIRIAQGYLHSGAPQPLRPKPLGHAFAKDIQDYPQAVSVLHVDVYKRQVLFCSARSSKSTIFRYRSCAMSYQKI